MKNSFAKVASVAGMAAFVTAAGLGFGAGTAQAQPKPVHPKPGPTTTMMHPRLTAFETRVDNFIDKLYPKGEQSPLDRFSDLFTPLAK